MNEWPKYYYMLCFITHTNSNKIKKEQKLKRTKTKKEPKRVQTEVSNTLSIHFNPNEK